MFNMQFLIWAFCLILFCILLWCVEAYVVPILKKFLLVCVMLAIVLICSSIFYYEKVGEIAYVGSGFIKYGKQSAVLIKNIDVIYFQEDMDFFKYDVETKEHILVVSDENVLNEITSKLTKKNITEESQNVEITDEKIYEKE